MASVVDLFTLRDVYRARVVVQRHLIRTPLRYSRTETWGEVSPRCIIGNGVEMCMPTAFTILYNVTTLRGVTPLTRG
jgi:hypothetical protein